MKLTNLKSDPVQVTYELEHVTPDRDGTTLTQLVTLDKVGSGWKASIDLTGFPQCSTPDEAARKLGEWLYRMSQVIMEEDGNFSKIDITNMDLTYLNK